MQKFSLKQAYAVNTGCEIRVIVCPELIDNKSAVFANEIVKKFQYPSGIKVNAIPEVRAVEFV